MITATPEARGWNRTLRSAVGVALLVLCAIMLWRPVRAVRRGGGASALWAAGAVAAFLVMSLTETSFQNEQFGALLLLVWAWGTAPLRAPDA